MRKALYKLIDVRNFYSYTFIVCMVLMVSKYLLDIGLTWELVVYLLVCMELLYPLLNSKDILNKNQFFKYPSIENSYNHKFVDRIKFEGYDKEEYCITEKIHGTNTQVAYYTDNDEFVYGTRERVLPRNEKCYNAQEIFEGLKNKMRSIVNLLQQKCVNNVKVVIFFGELYGGAYPHKEVNKDNHAIKVQKGVFYSQHNQWRAFDIAFKLKGEKHMHFLSWSDFISACEKVNLDHVPLLGICLSLDEALQFPNDKLSEVYKLNDLPEIEDNVMEGVVIKPLSKDLWIGSHRVILKNKNDKFKEKWREKKPDIQEEMPEIVKQAITEISAYINENRVNNVISHLGEVSVKDIGKIIGLSSQDALEDYKKEYGTLNMMEKSEEKMVTRYLNKEMSKIVRTIMMS